MEKLEKIYNAKRVFTDDKTDLPADLGLAALLENDKNELSYLKKNGFMPRGRLAIHRSRLPGGLGLYKQNSAPHCE